MKSVKFLVLPLLIALVLTLSAKSAEASNLYLTQDTQNLEVGQTAQVTIKLNTTSEDLNAVATNLSFPADKLEVESINTGSAFPILAEQTVDGNIIRLAQGSVTPANGDVTVATITFKAKVAGTANFSFAEGSAAPRFADSSDSLKSSQGTSLNITDSMVINEAGPSAIPAANEASQSASQTKLQTLSFDSIWNQILNLFNS